MSGIHFPDLPDLFVTQVPGKFLTVLSGDHLRISPHKTDINICPQSEGFSLQPSIPGPDRSGRISTQRLAVPHVIGAGPAQVGPLQEQVGESVQAEAGGEGANEAVETP